MHGEGSLFLLLDWGGLTLLDRGGFLVAVDVYVDLVAGRTVGVLLCRGGRLLRRLETGARLLKLVVSGKNT